MSSSTIVSKNLQHLARLISGQLKNMTGERLGFSLVVFNNEPGERVNYVSNCDRADVAAALRELLEHWEKGMPDIPAHQVD